MLPTRHIFAGAPDRQVGPKNPWLFRSLLLIAVLATAILAQIIEPGGVWRP
jgi:hypothetical protein